MYVDEGALAWDTPIRTVLPEFRLHDPVATAGMTPVDLLSHRSGLPRHDLFWYATGKSRTELIAGLHHLEPSASFRSKYQYQNLIALSNTSHTGTVPALVVRNAFDRMLGLEPIDWAARARKREAEAKAKVEEAKKADLAAAVADTKPSHPLADYAGDYEHAGYGKASVRVEGDGLILEVVGIEFPLEHYHYDLFSVPYDLPADAAAAGFGGVKIRFDYDDAGAINVVSVPLEPAISPIRFVRVSD